MKKTVNGFMDPATDICDRDGDFNDENITNIHVWKKAVLGTELPVKITIEIDCEGLSDGYKLLLQKGGWNL